LLRFVFVFAVVGNLGDGRNGIGGDLDQVETGLLGHVDCLAGADDADHIAVLVDQSDLRRFDFAVDARTLAGGRALLGRSGYGFILLRKSSGMERGCETRPPQKGGRGASERLVAAATQSR